jgi:flagellar biosynthetic protein FliR
MALSETVIGALAGLTARFTLDAAMTAGQVAGFPMGLGFSQMADPFNGVPSTALGRLFTIAALGYAVNLGLHREAIIWLYKSHVTWPPGSDARFATMLPGFLRMIADSISMGIRLSFPVLAAVTFGHITLGIVGKSAPQLNLASVGFSIAILCGGAALYMSVQPAAEFAANLAVNTLTQ